MNRYFDISVAIRPDLPVWSGDPPVTISQAASIAGGDIANVSRLDIGAHTGTHIDAPVHFVPGRKGIDRLELDTLIGPVYVADLTKVSYEINAADFQAAKIPSGTRRLLCKTTNSELWAKYPASFYRDFIGISADGAGWLVKNGIELVGVDYLGVERFEMVDQGAPTHHKLLEAGLIIVEGLNLTDIQAGEYTLLCLPVKIQNADGAPCRAILMKEI